MIPITYTYQSKTIRDKEFHYFKTEINGFKIERTFTKDSFTNVGKKDLGKLMVVAFKTYVVTTFRNNLKLHLKENN